MIYTFEWDPIKALSNYQKHKVRFEEAATILKDPNALTIYDGGHSDTEERWVTLGLNTSGKLLVVIHTYNIIDYQNVLIRIISARKATKNEIKKYNGDL